MEVEKDEDRQGFIQRKEEGINERRGRNKQNKRDSINKHPLPYGLWLQHYPQEQPSNPHRWLPETIKCWLSAMITNLTTKIISTDMICGNLCLFVFLLGHKGVSIGQLYWGSWFLFSARNNPYDIEKNSYLFSLGFFFFSIKTVSPIPSIIPLSWRALI